MRGEVSPAKRRAYRDRMQIAVVAQVAARSTAAPTTAGVDSRIEAGLSGDLYEKSESLRERIDSLDARITDLEP